MNTRQKIVDDAVEIAGREGRAPEQADFMTAAVLNQGSMSAEERRWLQQDLQAAELGTSSEGLGSWYPVLDEDGFEDHEDFPEAPEVWKELLAGCANCTWWDQSGYYEDEGAEGKERAENELRRKHQRESVDCASLNSRSKCTTQSLYT